MSQPRRIQLSRKKGWRLPPNTVVVARPSRWGNPFKLETNDAAGRTKAVALFRAGITEEFRAEVRARLRGKNLACWCPLDQPCHADVLLELAR